MVKMLRNAISLLLVMAILMSIMPCGMSISVMAAEEGEVPVTVRVPFIEYAMYRGQDGYKDNKGGYDTGGKLNGLAVQYIRTGALWKGAARLDLSAYEEILRNPSTTVRYEFDVGNQYSGGTCYDFKALLLPDNLDMYEALKLTFNDTNKLGYWSTDNPVLLVRSDGTELKGYNKHISGDVNKEALISSLDESYTNGKVSVAFLPGEVSGNSNIILNTPTSGLFITYYPSEIDNEEHLNTYKSKFEWDNLTEQGSEELTDSLPTYFRGATISWSDDSEELNLSVDGTLKRPRGGDVSATLTAEVRMDESSYTKDFAVTAPILLPVVKKVASKSAYTKQIGVKYQDTKYPTEYSAFYMGSNVMYDIPTSGRGDTHVFVKVDLSDYHKELEAATKVTFNLVNRNSSTTSNAMVAVLSNRYDMWGEDITYNSAIKSGMYTDPGYCIEYGCTVNSINNFVPAPIDTPEMMQAIKNAVAANPDEGIVSFRISSRDWNGISFQLSGGAGWPFVEITYYEEDLVTDKELQAAKKDKVQWTALTSQDMDNVVADLTLPATWYGAPVTWASSDETVITSSGEVIIGNEPKSVILTATVDGAVNTFNVTVPANKVGTQSEITHSVGYASGGSNLNYSAAIIYANEDIEGTPDVIIATYDSNGMLTEITVKENVVLEEGINCVPSEYHYVTSKYATTKAFVVDDIETLNPLGIAR